MDTKNYFDKGTQVTIKMQTIISLKIIVVQLTKKESPHFDEQIMKN